MLYKSVRYNSKKKPPNEEALVFYTFVRLQSNFHTSIEVER